MMKIVRERNQSHNGNRGNVKTTQERIEELRRQIAQAECVIALSALYRQQSELMLFQLTFAKASDKPVILMRPFGANQVLSKEITSLSDQIVDWDGRALVDAVKAQARHEESNRWDTIEFKLD